jgi:3-phenylpropionate/trans-cinnamate dioxygenase ferredoxin reductase subunit
VVSARKVEHLLIGGGLASANCARWLRESGAEGEILLVGREPDPPYNRPPCSKGYLQGAEAREDTYFRPQEWWLQQRIDLRTRTSVTKLDTAAKEATLSSKEVVAYDTALLATGANVRRLNAEGCELEGIHYLRALANADAIRAEAAGKRVVLIGGSYIGCEVAASLTLLGSSCTVVMQEAVTLERGFGAQAGEDELERFEGSDGRVGAVLTKGGLRLEADAVVIGAGVTPDTTLARAAGLRLDPEWGGVACDSMLLTSAPGVWAAGDVAAYDSVVHDRPIRVEHWDVAFNHGKTAALNMLGGEQPHMEVPYFFSDLADWASLEYVGPAQGWDEEVVRGSLSAGAFSVWYLKRGRVLGALSVGRSEDLDHARRMILAGGRLGEERAGLGDLGFDLEGLGR